MLYDVREPEEDRAKRGALIVASPWWISIGCLGEDSMEATHCTHACPTLLYAWLECLMIYSRYEEEVAQGVSWLSFVWNEND